MSMATLPKNDKVITVKSIIDNEHMKRRFTDVLGGKADKFLAALTSQVSASYLSKCDPMSVVAAAFTAATLDLPVNKELGFAWIVPYGSQAQFQVGYKGYVQLAQRSGRFKKLNAFTVNAEMLQGFDEVGEPRFDFALMDPTKPAVGYGCVFVLDNGYIKSEYWSRERCEQHGKRFSKSYDRKDSAWQTSFDAMALKTVIIHTLRRWGPMTVDLQVAMRHDQATQERIDAVPHYVDTEIPLLNESQHHNFDRETWLTALSACDTASAITKHAKTLPSDLQEDVRNDLEIAMMEREKAIG